MRSNEEAQLSSIDYTNYSIEELEEVLSSIDKESFPENYESLLWEIEKSSVISVQR